MRQRRLLAILLVALCCGSPLAQAARAQTGVAPELQAPDPAAAAQAAEAALARGGLKSEQWVALQRELGVARARMGDTEQARRAFICALALEPGLRLADDEAVEVRSPFMEARGFWSLQPERLGTSAAWSDDGSALLISLIDPAALVARVVVRARGAGQRQFVEWSLAPAASVHASLEALSSPRELEYSVALIDENANRLWQLGSDAEPMRARRAVVEPVALVQASAPAAVALEPARPYYVGAAVSLLVAGGAAAVAGVSHAEREQLAAQWNSADCAGDGTTRGEVCGHEHDQIERYQRLAIGFYSLAGAGLVTGVVMLIIAPTRAERERRAARAVRCRPGAGLVGMECTARF